MHNFFASAELYLGIAPDGMALLKSGKRGGCQVLAESVLAPQQSATSSALAGALQAMLKDAPCRGRAIHIVLADSLVRSFMVTPPLNTRSLQDCQAAAAMRFHELFGESLAGWELQADWDGRRAFLACALPQTLHAMLRQLAADYRWTLLSVVPHFIAAWNRWRKQLDGNAWFAVALGGRMTLAAMEGGALRAIHASRIDPEIWHNEQSLPAYLSREALRLNLNTPPGLRICGRLDGVPASRVELAPGCRRLDAGLPAIDYRAPSAAVLARTGMAA